MGLPDTSAKAIFLDALELTTVPDRKAYVETHCGTDTDLRREVEQLLKVHGVIGDFLESPPTAVVESAEHLRTSALEIPSLSFLTSASSANVLGRLDHYEIVEVVGNGGMGVVLKGFDERLRRVVAIKAMNPQLAASAINRQRFVREAQAAAAVNHDNVVHIYAVEETGPVPYLVMEYIPGISLEEKLKQVGSLPLREILRIGLQAADGLAAAHRQGLVHRDVKPANILLENGVERVKITDFGLARAADDVSVTQIGVIAGTPAYMSPEQARGEAVDHRSDLFSLGSVLYVLCTGQSPFAGDTALGIVKRVCEDTPRPIREFNPQIPLWLCEIIENLHSKLPQERFQSAAELAEVLGDCLAHVQEPSNPLPTNKAPRKNLSLNTPYWSRQIDRRWVITSVAALILGCVTLSLTEAKGITHLAATVIRILTPDGTLVIETDDPAVKVTIEGDGGLVINGAGPQEVRLKPGSYQVEATKDGKPVKREVVTITQAGKQTVKVSVEEQVPTLPVAPGEIRRYVGHADGVQSVAISPDGHQIASGSDDKTVRLWNLDTGKELRSFTGHTDKVYSVAFSPDGRRILSGSFDLSVRLWDVATGKELRSLTGHADLIACVAYSPDGRHAVSGGNDHTVRLWDLENGDELRRFAGHTQPIYSIAFSPDGRRILSSGWDKTLRLWDIESAEEQRRFEGHTDVVKCVTFSPDGRQALSAGARDKTVRLWDLETGKELRRFEGHRAWAHSVVFSPDGTKAVSGGDRTVYLWDLQSGKLMRTFLGHTGEVASVAITPDGRFALSSGFTGDNSLRLWELPGTPVGGRQSPRHAE